MIGVVSLRQLLLNDENKILKDVMEKDFIYVNPEDDQEKVANIVSEYNYLALPVLNEEQELIGIITVDDVMDVIREEATEDMLKMAGAGVQEDILLKPVIENAKTRFPWLMPSWIGGLLAMCIISFFEDFMTEHLILASFIPIIIGNEKTALEFGKYLFKNGIFAQPIRFPTVKKNSARIRFSITAWHTNKQINETLSVIEKCTKKFKIV